MLFLIGRPWTALLFGIAFALFLGPLAADAWVLYATAPSKPRPMTVSEAAATRGARAWVVLEDAHFREKSSLRIPNRDQIDTLVPITGASGRTVIFARVFAHRANAPLVNEGLLEDMDRRTIEQVEPLVASWKRLDVRYVSFRPGYTPEDDRTMAIVATAMTPLLLVAYPIFLWLRRERGVSRPNEVRLAGIVPIMFGVVVVLSREMPIARLALAGAVANVALGFGLIASAHTESVRRLLARLDRVPAEDVERALAGPGTAPPVQPDAPSSTDGFVLEPELTAPIPRPIPSSVLNGPTLKAINQGAWVVVLVGLALLAAGLIGAFDQARESFAPLGYASWIGGLLAAAGVVGFVRIRLGLGDGLSYVVRGTPIAARIESLSIEPLRVGFGVPSFHVHIATISVRHPDTGEACVREVRSRPVPHAMSLLRVGEVRTAVFMPGAFDKTLALFGFLRLTDASDAFAAPSSRSTRRAEIVAGAGVVFALLVALVTIFVSLQHFPLDFDAWVAIPTILIGLGVGVPAGRATHRVLRLRHEADAARAAQAASEGRAAALVPQPPSGLLLVGTIFMFTILTAMTVMCSFMIVNAVFDRSEAEYRCIKVTNEWEETHAFVFHAYQVEYVEGESKPKMLQVPADVARQLDRGDAALEVHRGRFGWPWVKTIHRARSVAEGVAVEVEPGRWVRVK